MRIRQLIIFTLVFFPAFVQGQVVDSLKKNFITRPQTAIDSIQFSFYNKADSLKEIYRNRLGAFDVAENVVRTQIDSVQSIQQPVVKYVVKLDSINWKRQEATVALNDKVEKLKSSALEKLSKIPATSEMGEISSLVTKNIELFKLPVKDLNMPSLNASGNTLAKSTEVTLELVSESRFHAISEA
jgi:hypothetical protein